MTTTIECPSYHHQTTMPSPSSYTVARLLRRHGGKTSDDLDDGPFFSV
jgi:hypothetical protein